MKRIRFNLDALGVCASTLCMVHCLVFPLLLVALPLWNTSAKSQDSGSTQAVADNSATTKTCCPVGGECCAKDDGSSTESENADQNVAACCATPTDFWIHIGLLATVAPLGLVAWGMGYRQHRRFGVLCLGLIGVLLLSGALLFGTRLWDGRGEQVMTVMGSICMVSAHLWNRRQCRCCRTQDLEGVVEIEDAPSPSGRLQLMPGEN